MSRLLKVSIEEHLVTTIEVEIPKEVDDSFKYAEKLITQRYRTGEIVLDADNFSGVTLMNICDENNGIATDWFEV